MDKLLNKLNQQDNHEQLSVQDIKYATEHFGDKEWKDVVNQLEGNMRESFQEHIDQIYMGLSDKLSSHEQFSTSEIEQLQLCAWMYQKFEGEKYNYPGEDTGKLVSIDGVRGRQTNAIIAKIYPAYLAYEAISCANEGEKGAICDNIIATYTADEIYEHFGDQANTILEYSKQRNKESSEALSRLDPTLDVLNQYFQDESFSLSSDVSRSEFASAYPSQSDNLMQNRTVAESTYVAIPGREDYNTPSVPSDVVRISLTGGESFVVKIDEGLQEKIQKLKNNNTDLILASKSDNQTEGVNMYFGFMNGYKITEDNFHTVSQKNNGTLLVKNLDGKLIRSISADESIQALEVENNLHNQINENADIKKMKQDMEQMQSSIQPMQDLREEFQNGGLFSHMLASDDNADKDDLGIDKQELNEARQKAVTFQNNGLVYIESQLPNWKNQRQQLQNLLKDVDKDSPLVGMQRQIQNMIDAYDNLIQQVSSGENGEESQLRQFTQLFLNPAQFYENSGMTRASFKNWVKINGPALFGAVAATILVFSGVGSGIGAIALATIAGMAAGKGLQSLSSRWAYLDETVVVDGKEVTLDFDNPHNIELYFRGKMDGKQLASSLFQEFAMQFVMQLVFMKGLEGANTIINKHLATYPNGTVSKMLKIVKPTILDDITKNIGYEGSFAGKAIVETGQEVFEELGEEFVEQGTEVAGMGSLAVFLFNLYMTISPRSAKGPNAKFFSDNNITQVGELTMDGNVALQKLEIASLANSKAVHNFYDQQGFQLVEETDGSVTFEKKTTLDEEEGVQRVQIKEKVNTVGVVTQKLNGIITDNNLLNKEQKDKLFGKVESMNNYSAKTKKIYDNYSTISGRNNLFEKVIGSDSIQEVLEGVRPEGGLEMQFVDGTIVFDISDKKFFDKLGIAGGLLPEINIDGTPIKVIIMDKNLELYEKVLHHELQHFVNSFIINYEGNINDQVLGYLQDEVIAQTIHGSYGYTAQDFIQNFTYAISKSTGTTNKIGYAFGNLAKDPQKQIMLNSILLQHTDKIELAYQLRDSGIENYQHILSTTPFLEWDKISINKEKSIIDTHENKNSILDAVDAGYPKIKELLIQAKESSAEIISNIKNQVAKVREDIQSGLIFQNTVEGKIAQQNFLECMSNLTKVGIITGVVWIPPFTFVPGSSAIVLFLTQNQQHVKKLMGFTFDAVKEIENNKHDSNNVATVEIIQYNSQNMSLEDKIELLSNLGILTTYEVDNPVENIPDDRMKIFNKIIDRKSTLEEFGVFIKDQPWNFSEYALISDEIFNKLEENKGLYLKLGIKIEWSTEVEEIVALDVDTLAKLQKISDLTQKIGLSVNIRNLENLLEIDIETLSKVADLSSALKELGIDIGIWGLESLSSLSLQDIKNITKLKPAYQELGINLTDQSLVGIKDISQNEIDRVRNRIPSIKSLGIDISDGYDLANIVALKDEQYKHIVSMSQELVELGLRFDTGDLKHIAKVSKNDLQNIKNNQDNIANLIGNIYAYTFPSLAKLDRTQLERLTANKDMYDELGLDITNGYMLERLLNYDREQLKNLIGLQPYLEKLGINLGVFDIEHIVNISGQQLQRIIDNHEFFQGLGIETNHTYYVEGLTHLSIEDIARLKNNEGTLSGLGVKLNAQNIILISKLLKEQSISDIRKYLQKSKEFLSKNRKLSDEKFIELFGKREVNLYYRILNFIKRMIGIPEIEGTPGINAGKWGRAEINQRSLGYCYAYIGNEIMKSSNYFETMIKTSVEIVDGGYKVTIPFGSKDGTTYFIKNNEIDKPYVISNDNGNKREVNVNSHTSLGFKVLEIAFIKHYVLSGKSKISNIDEIRKSFDEIGDFTLTSEMLKETEGGFTNEYLGEMLGGVVNSAMLKDIEMNQAEKLLDLLASGRAHIGLSSLFMKDEVNQGIQVLQTSNNGDIVESYKVKGLKTSLHSRHAYSIERSYINENTGERMVVVINPRDTSKKIIMTLGQCVKAFNRWAVANIDTNQMFNE